MAKQFLCSQCPMVLNESERRQHISAKHLNYFPFECAICREAYKKHSETTEADMDEHIATYHNGNNLGIILLKDQAKEIALNKMIEQCHRWQEFQEDDSEDDSKDENEDGSEGGIEHDSEGGIDLVRMTFGSIQNDNESVAVFPNCGN
ncbi:putative zinc finger protein R05D3.3 [Ditylenchus destructor]|nr:putative zinc finger protein R05D3.3 [Ditylenchus destructor]